MVRESPYLLLPPPKRRSVSEICPYTAEYGSPRVRRAQLGLDEGKRQPRPRNITRAARDREVESVFILEGFIKHQVGGFTPTLSSPF